MSTRRHREAVANHPGIRRTDSGYEARIRGRDGKTHSKAFARLGDADRWVVAQKATKHRGGWVDPRLGEGLLRAQFAKWMARAEEADFPAPSTRAKYQTVWTLHVDEHLGGYPVAAICRDDVEQMRDVVKRRSGPYQAGEALKLARMLLGREVARGAIVHNPAVGVSPPATARTMPRILAPAEIDAIVAALAPRWRAMVLVGAYASLRWSELVALRRDDLDLEARRLRVDEKCVEVAGEFRWGSPKTRASARTVDLPELVVAPLATHLLRFPPLHDAEPGLDGLVFYGARGGVVRRHVFRKVWVRACAQVGVEGVRVEWLRHTGASLAYAATRDLKAVSERLGHTSVRMADQVYVGLYEEAGRGVADAIDELVRSSRGAGVGQQ